MLGAAAGAALSTALVVGFGAALSVIPVTAAAFARATREMRESRTIAIPRCDPVAVTTTFKAVLP